MRLTLAAVISFGLGGCSVAKAPSDSAPATSQQAIMAACCGASDSAAVEENRRYESTPEAQRPPEVAIIPYRMTSGLHTRERVVITDSNAWSKIWTTIPLGHSPTPRLPAVDFERETIVVAAMGQRSSGGYTISIDSARVSGDTVTVVVTEHSPGRTCGTTAALSAPVAVARIFRPRAVVLFVERTTVIDCG